MARPLDKKNEKGELYRRPQGVENKIDAAIGQDRAELGRRARVTDKAHPDYLPPECLVHLIRDALRCNDQKRASALMQPLLARCAANLKVTVPESKQRNAEGIHQDILSDFASLFTADAGETALDFFECRFWRAFRTLRIDGVRSEMSARKDVTDLPEITTEEGERVLDEDLLADLSRDARVPASQESRVLVRETLAQLDGLLKPDEKRAIILCRVFGYDIESDDPTKRTAATICKVSGRTIRNWLRRADEQMKKFMEEQS